MSEISYNGLLFEWNEETNGWKLKKALNEPVRLDIPSSVEGKPVTMIGEYVFTEICSAGVDGVSANIADPLSEPPPLSYVRVPSSVRVISYCAFYGCRELEYIDLPDRMDEIRAGAFCFCGNLREINIPKGISVLQRITFRGASGLTSVVIPDSVQEIEFSAFEDCDGLEKVTFGKGLRKIGNRAFWGCISLTCANLPDGLEYIGDGAFAETALTAVHIPKGVREVPKNVFRNCTELKSIIYAEDSDAAADSGMDMCSRWVFKKSGNPGAEVRLICFHYAGGNASWYDKWEEKCKGAFELMAIQLPMRGARFEEKMPETMEELAEWFIRDCRRLFDKPFILFGHSMGALLAYETAYQLKRDMDISPQMLVISACEAPFEAEIERNDYSARTAPDDKLLEVLENYGQTNSELLEYPEFLEYYLPIVRQDFCICERYSRIPDIRLKCRLMVLRGTDDISVSDSSCDRWKDYTESSVQQYKFSGGHFYAEDHIEELMELICNENSFNADR